MAVATVTGHVHTLTQAHPRIDCIVILNTNPQRPANTNLADDVAVFSRMKGRGASRSPQELHSGFDPRRVCDILVSIRDEPETETAGGPSRRGYLWGLLPDLQSEGPCVRLCSFSTKTHSETSCPSGRHAVIMWLFYSDSSGL